MIFCSHCSSSWGAAVSKPAPEAQILRYAQAEIYGCKKEFPGGNSEELMKCFLEISKWWAEFTPFAGYCIKLILSSVMQFCTWRTVSGFHHNVMMWCCPWGPSWQHPHRAVVKSPQTILFLFLGEMNQIKFMCWKERILHAEECAQSDVHAKTVNNKASSAVRPHKWHNLV